MKKWVCIFFLFQLLSATVILATESASASTIRYGRKWANPFRKYPLQLSTGCYIIDDNGEKLKSMFDLKDSWNIPYYPNFFQIQRGFSPKFTAYINLSYSIEKKAGKGYSFKPPVNILSMDAGIHFSIISLYEKNSPRFRKTKKIVDLYLLNGLGYKYKTTFKGGFSSFNFGGGMFIKIDKEFAFFAEAQGIFAITKHPDTIHSSYKNYLIGFTYTIPPPPFYNPLPKRFRPHKPK
jgi:hypothetical protein